MKKVTVTISFDEEKLSALRLYLKPKDQQVETELEKALDTLYTKTVPQGVREYIDMCAATPRSSPKPRRQRPAEPVPAAEATNPPTS